MVRSPFQYCPSLSKYILPIISIPKPLKLSNSQISYPIRRVISPSAKSPPGKVNASQIIAHQLNAVWSQVAASRYERHYDADKCIIVRRKRLYYAVVTSKYILEVHLPGICVIKCQRGGKPPGSFYETDTVGGTKIRNNPERSGTVKPNTINMNIEIKHLCSNDLCSGGYNYE